MSDWAVAAAFAAGRVPDGVSADYLSESRDGPAIAAVGFVLGLTTLIVASRVWSRASLSRFGLDDGLALLSLAFMVPFVALCIVLINIGSGRHYDYIMYVMPETTVEYSEVLDFAAHLVYTTALLVCRLSGLAFYYRLCRLHDEFVVAIRIVAAVLVAAYLPQILLIIFHCAPVTGLWPYDWQPGVNNYTCLQWGIVYSVNSSVSLFCDLLLFGIPLAMLRTLGMPISSKVQLGCILCPGVLVVGISVARLVLVINGQWDADESWSYNPMLAVEVSEIGGTLIAISVPGIKPIVDRLIAMGKRLPDADADHEPYGSWQGGNGSGTHRSRWTTSRHPRSNGSVPTLPDIAHLQHHHDKEPASPSHDGQEHFPSPPKTESFRNSTDGILVRRDSVATGEDGGMPRCERPRSGDR